jgi:hypothetical protein
VTKVLTALCCLIMMAATVNAAEDIAGRPQLRVADRKVAISPETTGLLVDKIRPYAAMSELAYRPSLTEMPQDEAAKKEELELRAKGWAQLDKWLTAQRWQLLDHKSYPSGEKSDETLECDFWINKGAVPPQVVVAFRGTGGDENREREQYAAVHAPAFQKDVMEAWRVAGPDAVLTATGHSLGGGLAEHLFYYSQLWPVHVAQATVFEPSSLTGKEFGSERERIEAQSRFTALLAAATTHWKFPEVMAYDYGFGVIRVNERYQEGSILLSMFRASKLRENHVAVFNFLSDNPGQATENEMAKLAQDLYYYPAAAPAPPSTKTARKPAPMDADLYRILNQS